jgi:predicted permease
MMLPMGAFFQDVRYGVRVLLQNPGFTMVAVAGLALGIAVNTTVFSWIDAVLLRPLPGVERDIVALEVLTPNGEFVINSYPDYRDYRDHLRLVSGLAVAQPAALSIGEENSSQRIWGELVSGNYFAVLGVRPVRGRMFSPDEYGDKPGAYPVAVISERLWRSRFRSDPSVVGATLRVNRQELTVVGIAPREFRGAIPGLTFDLWVPVMMGPQLNGIGEWMLRDRKTRNLLGLARLKPGVPLAQVRAEIAGIGRELARLYPQANAGVRPVLLPIGEAHVGAQSLLRTPLRILMVVCGVVLLIVCANVANLLLARSVARRKEFCLRLALGASRSRVARQLLTESLLLAFIGTVLSVPLALALGRSLGYLLPPTGFPLDLNAGLGATLLGFSALVCIAATVFSGLAPALQSARSDLSEAMKEGSRGTSSGGRSHRLRGALVVAEVALAFVAVVGALLFARSFEAARSIDPGFDTDNVLVSQFHLSGAGYSVQQRKEFCLRLRRLVEQTPGVVSAAYADHVPLGFTPAWWEDLVVEGYVPGPSENMKIHRAVVAPGYFDLVRIPLLEGRDFREDDEEKSLPVMIVNQAFARRFFAGRNPIGRKVRGWGQWFTVVGLARDSRYNNVAEAPLPFFYVPFRQVYRADMNIAFYMRTASDPNRALPALRAAARSLDPNVGVFDAMPLAEYTAASLYPQKVAATLLGVLGALSLLLAALGLYSVMAYMVRQRTHEVGIRMALGARPGDVLRAVVGRGMLLAAAGLAAGAAGALVSTQLVRGVLVGISPTDPRVFLGAAVFLATVAALASFVPARHATRVDPIRALRHE